MSKTLVIQLPDELQEQLLQRAKSMNISLESLVLQSLTQLVSSETPDEFDPISPLLGTLTAEVNDTHNCQLTTQEAANILNVSRPFIIKLLEAGEIPYVKVGSHPQVIFQDLMKYKEQRRMNRKKGLQELTQFLQDEGFYEEEVGNLEQ
ncbi:helix-turn-helix domain-containing protein [Argonema antarcticum]|uniref:helix-turn-helix domain-containing protein n=1 Tax=Argonema antarcticum TaxID=2942763 RepID=UPI0020131CED|nr:helix-turn-helix domain-containing protein [Argonema antarcticum]MCL1471990.1 helix-turn-helix domain-containing protein [Argonema antarcticum A004/B2]